MDDLRIVEGAVPGASVLIGSGLGPESDPALLAHAGGAIVGSAVMTAGRPGAGIDPDRAAAFIEAVRPRALRS